MRLWLIIALTAASFATSAADLHKGGFGAQNPNQTATPSENPAPKTTKRTSYPFHGTLASIDSSGKSLSLKGQKKERLILFTAETRFFKNGAKATFRDASAGERVTGTVRKNASGQEEAVTVRYNAPAK